MRSRRERLTLVLAVGLVAVATLVPGDPSPDGEALSPYCVFCGERGTADAVVNLLLFIPLGAVLSTRWSAARALFVGAALSACVEIAQTAIPGRFPTLGDILWNALGAGAGALLWRARFRPRGWRNGWRAALGAGLLSIPLLPALLMGSAPTPYDYFAQWAPSVSERSYPGRVTVATLDGLEMNRGRLPGSDQVREALARGAPLRVSFVAAAPPDRPSIVFRFVDARSHEIAEIGVRGNDLIWWERTRADALGFGSPGVVLQGALDGVRSGAEVRALVQGEGGSLCMRLDTLERCGLIPRLRDGWRLLAPGAVVPFPFWMAGLVWLTGPALLAGLVMARRPLPALFFLPIAAGLVRFLPGVAADWLDLAILSTGFISGVALARSVAAPDA